jgi:hypothetical protein
MSSIAVFLVVSGGSAFAANTLGKNTVGTKQLKNNAVTGAKIKNGAVTGAKIQTSSLGTVPSATNAVHASAADTATHATSANSATTATNAEALGGAPAAAYQQKANILFATVAPAGASPKILRGRGAVSVEQDSTGYYGVTFNRDVSNCTWLATYGPPENNGVDALWATVRGGPSPDEVRIVLWNEEGLQKDGLGFDVEVLCP